MNQYYPNLFSPLKVKNHTFRNRIFSTPNAVRFKNHIATSFFEAKAKGGAAVVTVNEAPISRKWLRVSTKHVFVLDDLNDLPALAETATAIRIHGAAPSIQLYHPGMFGKMIFADSPNPVGPMGFVRDDGVEVTAMDEELIEEVTEAYADAAAMVQRAGFEMCQIHGAHGWLLAQFLSSRVNKRNDKYGGKLENRARFPIAVVDRIRARCGPDFIIEYRVSGDELVENGMKVDEVIEFVKMLEGKIDFIHVSAGIHEAHHTIHRQFAHTMFTEHGCNVPLAEAVKKAVNIPVVAVGGISYPEHAEQILAEGKADIIGMARALIADPEFPNKARNGRADQIIPCLRCNYCLLSLGDDNFTCVVNPTTGRDPLRWQGVEAPSGSRKVLVVGGGPGGMEAAITAADRGHEVTLYEKADSLGGILRIADYDDLKSDMKVYKDYLVRMTMEKIKVHLNAECTPELIKRLSPDVVIAAVGAVPIIPDIPGINRENVFSAEKVYYHAEKTGDKVAIIGGGLVGCETALFLAEQYGKTVTILEMRESIGDQKDWRHTIPLVMKIDELENISYKTGIRCKEIKEKGVNFVDADGKEDHLEADSVIYAVGMKPKTDIVDRLREAAVNFYPVGDCVRAQRIVNATQSAYYAAVDIR
ncbi:MAG: FAD-dependent oxidoreductase [Bacillota bacterium]|nr:FAD-dependent oxidoreductase [Bacillota bacterium]